MFATEALAQSGVTYQPDLQHMATVIQTQATRRADANQRAKVSISSCQEMLTSAPTVAKGYCLPEVS